MSAWGLSQETRTITVVVDASETAPDSGEVFIAGNLSVLGDWVPDAVPLRPLGNGLWSISFDAPLGSTVEFKVTQGSWVAQAIYEPGVIPGNTMVVCLRDTTVTLKPRSWGLGAGGEGGGVVGTVVRHGAMTGEGLRYGREVAVVLPPSYDREPQRRFPVLYMHDGQNVFDPKTSFLGFDWRVDEVADSLVRTAELQEFILVALWNTPDRRPEYSDTPRGRAYADFVVHQVKPFIDSTYRTLPGPRHTAVMGSSMGGLISFLFAWWYPDVFGHAACLSSAFTVDDGGFLRAVRKYSGPKKPVRFYLDCGGIDLDERLAPGLWEMASILKALGYKEGEDLSVFYDPGASHNEMAWAARVWRPLKFIFGTDR
jgi:predicted alpha/beta superfamily hydrolase